MTSSSRPIETEYDFVFSVDSALLVELGEKLVSSVHVALSELVKNSYDADARTVHISINAENNSTRLIVEDDGIGMNLDEVQAYWMRIGTGNKIANPISKVFGRRKTGAKGVGRFACRRLGLNLKLTTTSLVEGKSKKSSQATIFQTTTIVFNWNDFHPGTTVEDVKSVGHTQISDTGKTGTRLEIWGAERNEWSKTGFDYLQRQLGILATNMGAKRLGFEEDLGFNVHLSTELFDGRAVDLRKEIIDAGWGTVNAHIDEDGRAVCVLHAMGGPGTKRIKSQAKFKDIVGASLTIGVFPQDKAQFRRPEILSKQSAQTIVDDWGGIHVKHNGFRVYPYGDSEDDWLRIEADRARRLGKPTDEELFSFAATLQGVDAGRTLLNMLSRKNYIGYVDVSSEIQGLVPRLDRQGFITSDAFTQLKAFARFAIDWMNIYRDFYIRNQIEEDATRAFNDVQLVLKEHIPKEQLVPKVASYLRQEIKKIVQYLPEDDKKNTEKSLLTTLRAIETNNQANVRQLEHLRLIASASTLTLLFAHEVRTLIGALGATSNRIKRIARKVNQKDADELNSLATQIDSTKSRFDDLIEMTGIVGAFGQQKEIQSIHLRSAVERAVRCFSLVTETYKIKIDSSQIPGNFVVGPMVEGEIYTILINILSNGIKSLIASGNKNKQMQFSAYRKDTRVIIDIYDNGVGLDKQHFEEVFKPFVSDPDGSLYEQLEQTANPQDAHMFGTGSGLGLAITRDIVIARKGDLSFQIPPQNWNVFIELRLPCPTKN